MCPKWRGLCGTFTLAASLAILGCGTSGNSNVRAVNASSGFPAFTFQVGQIGIGVVPYGMEGVQPKGQFSTLDSTGIYRAVGAGANQAVIAYVASSANPLATAKQTLLKNASYTIVSVGAAVSLGGPTGMTLDVLTDDGAAPASGQFSFRFLNASTSSATGGAIDVYITAVGAVPSGNPTIGNVPFNQLQNYMAGSPGTLELQVTPHGSTHVLATLPFAPTAGSLYSIFFLDPPAPGSTNFSILVVDDPIAPATTMS